MKGVRYLLIVDRETGKRRRHHLHESVIQRAVKEAVRQAGIAKPASINGDIMKKTLVLCFIHGFKVS